VIDGAFQKSFEGVSIGPTLVRRVDEPDDVTAPVRAPRRRRTTDLKESPPCDS
jgi:hypothetical protein